MQVQTIRDNSSELACGSSRKDFFNQRFGIAQDFVLISANFEAARKVMVPNINQVHAAMRYRQARDKHQLSIMEKSAQMNTQSMGLAAISGASSRSGSIYANRSR